MLVGWENLKVLLAIHREGSLTAAAHVLGLDQSTVGRKLNTLEAELGSILFVRSKAGFAATDAGLAAVRRAQEVEQTVTAMVDDVSAADAGAVGTVRLRGNAWSLDLLTRRACAAFLRDNPRLDLRMMTLSPQTRLRGEATVGLWFEVEPQSGHFALELGEVPYAVYCARDLAEPPRAWVMFEDENAPRPAIATQVQKLRKPDEPLRLVSSDAQVLMSAVCAGIGRGLLPMCMAEAHQALKRVQSGPPEMLRMLHMHVHPDTLETKRVQAVLAWLRRDFDKVFLPR